MKIFLLLHVFYNMYELSKTVLEISIPSKFVLIVLIKNPPVKIVPVVHPKLRSIHISFFFEWKSCFTNILGRPSVRDITRAMARAYDTLHKDKTRGGTHLVVFGPLRQLRSFDRDFLFRNAPHQHRIIILLSSSSSGVCLYARVSRASHV